MSAEEFFLDLVHGNISNALARLENWLGTVPDSVKLLIQKLESDSGKFVSDLAKTAAKDIVSGGIMNTASYVTAAKDILAQATSAGFTVLLPDVFAILNAEVSYLINAQGLTDESSAPTDQAGTDQSQTAG